MKDITLREKKDGNFDVIAKDDYNYSHVNAKLKVCKNCLQELEWANYQFAIGKDKQNKIRDLFSISDFFDKYKSLFSEIPSRVAEEDKAMGYSKDHKKFSFNYRTEANWICQDKECNRNFVNHKSLLQLHHINGVKDDYRASNLKVLCKLCHSKQPKHSFKLSKKELDTILSLETA